MDQCDDLVFGAKRVSWPGVALALVFSIVLLARIFLHLQQLPSQADTQPVFPKTGIAKAAIHPPESSHPGDSLAEQPPVATELIYWLKKVNLWEIKPNDTIPLVLQNNYPPNLSLLEDIALKKKVFLHTLLPVVLKTLQEVRQERRNFLRVVDKIPLPLESLLFEKEDGGGFADDYFPWQEYLTEPEIDFISTLTRKYRTIEAEKLYLRIDVLPVSLILAQAAIESSWGGSRFTSEGNNVFGVWTWGERGMIPREREEGKNHKVRSYDSILDSTRAYLLTLNRLPAYTYLRQLRQQTEDPLTLAEGLLRYSERGEEYIQDIIRVIEINQLEKYDTITLDLAKKNNEL